MSLNMFIRKGNHLLDWVLGLGFDTSKAGLPPHPAAVRASLPRLAVGIRPRDYGIWQGGPEQVDRFLRFAYIGAERSHCVRSKVGAVVVDRNGAIVGVGSNLIPGAGTEDCTYYCPRSTRSYEEVPAGSPYDTKGSECFSLHAEAQAVKNTMARFPNPEVPIVGALEGYWAFVTRKPCYRCEGMLDEYGIRFMWNAG